MKIHHYIIIACVALLSGCGSQPNKDNGDDGALPQAPDTLDTPAVVRIIDSTGGTLSATEGGITVTLDIPAGALVGSREVSLTFSSAAADTFLKQRFLQKVVIGPAGLLLREPATLTVSGADSMLGEQLAAVCWLNEGGIPFPLGFDEAQVLGPLLSGLVLRFGTFSGGILDEASAERVYAASQALLAKAAPGFRKTAAVLRAQACDPIDFGWEDADMIVRGMVKMAERALLLGNLEAYENYSNAANGFFSQFLDEFMQQPVPDNPCGAYMRALSRYVEGGMRLGVVTETSPAYERFSGLVDSCSMTFTVEIDHQETDEAMGDEATESELRVYGTARCYVSWGDVMAQVSGYKVRGSGILSYSYSEVTDESEYIAGDTKVNGNGVIRVVCTGSSFLHDSTDGTTYPAMTMRLEYHYDIVTTTVVTNSDGTSETTTDYNTEVIAETVQLVLSTGARTGFSGSNPATGYSGHDYKTVTVINSPGNTPQPVECR